MFSERDAETLVEASTTLVEVVEAGKARLGKIIAMTDQIPNAVGPATESRAKALLRRWGEIPPTANADEWAMKIKKQLKGMEERLAVDALNRLHNILQRCLLRCWTTTLPRQKPGS